MILVTYAHKARFGLFVLLLCLLVLTVMAVRPSQSQAEAGPAQPDKVIRPDGAKPGVYYIDYGSSNFDPNVYPVDGAIRFYGWNVLNPSDGDYNWAELDNWIATRKAKGLGTGIMITTYDGSDAGDIRSTPNFVIKQANAVLAATYKNAVNDANDANQPHYINYWRNTAYNANFDNNTHTLAWNLSGNVDIVSNAPVDPDGVAGGYAGMLGGGDFAAGYLAHWAERIPAMPAGISPAKTVYVTARVGIVTSDPHPSDHLTIEIWDTNGVKLGGTQVDINNLSHANNTWASYEFDVSAFASERSVQVVFKVSTDSFYPTTFYVDNVGLMVRHLIPNYWPDTDAQRTYYKAYKKFIDAMGARYKNNPDLQFVAMGAGLYGENQPTQSDAYPYYHFDHVVEKYGNLTGADWVTYVKQITSDYAAAFSAGDGTGPARHLFTQYAPTYKAETERKDTTDYAQSLGVGLSSNFLPVDWPQSFRPDNVGFYDPVRRYWSSVPLTFESYTMDLCNPAMAYWALFTGLDKHVDYLRTDPTLFRNADGSLTAIAPLYGWAQDYLGKTAQNTPKAWTVMREHSNPGIANCRSGGVYYAGPSTWPQLGNYNFFLTQTDSVTGGRTAPETNNKGFDSRYAKDPSSGTWWSDAGLGNCPTANGYRTDLFGTDYPCYKTPYNPDLPPLVGQDNTYYSRENLKLWTGAGKEALYVRRTDQATDNPYMFFRIDDEYMKGDAAKVFKAAITVKYFDIGTDKFSVKYDSVAGEKIAGTVTKTGTKVFKTVTFTVNDAKFLNRLAGNTDFYLDSRDPGTNAKDGNEWVHMVEVEWLDRPVANTPTPTVTVTPSITPQPTTGIVTGKAYYDVNGNNKLDAGEPGLAGAEIVLVDYSSDQEAYSATSGADGTYTLGGVTPGQYTLREKIAPPGYAKSAYSITFLVQANVTTSLGTNFPHTPLVTSTPTPSPTHTSTPTATPSRTRTPTQTYTAIPRSPFVYLPLICKPLPPAQAAPQLLPIVAPEANPSYTVAWSGAEQAITYVLERAPRPDFIGAEQFPETTATERLVDSAGIATYYYRVKVRGATGDSAWSNAQAVQVRWELEPNSKPAEALATGPLQTGLDYYGRLSETDPRGFDYFYFRLAEPRRVQLWLSHMAPGQDFNLALFDDGLAMLRDSGNRDNSEEHIDTQTPLPAGDYYVRVGWKTGASSEPYYLRGAW